MNSDFNVAVHALVYMSHRGGILSSETLAENICTNPARVRKVMAKLGRAGFIHTKEGLEGGYQLAQPAQAITLAGVSRALAVQFVRTSWKSGDPAKPCLVASGMGPVMDELYARLDSLCKGWLEQITVAHVEARIFSGKEPGEPGPCRTAQPNQSNK